MSNSELWKPKRSKLQERWKVFDFEVKKNWTPREKLDVKDRGAQGLHIACTTPDSHSNSSVQESTGACTDELMSLSLTSSDSQSEHICEDQPFSGGNGGGQSGSLSDEHNTVARSLVVGEELMVSGLVTRPMVTGLEPAEVNTSSDASIYGHLPGDEIVVEVWQLKSIPRGLLDVNELDICLSVYNEAFMECLQSTQDAVQQKFLFKHWKLTTRHVLSVMSDSYVTQRLQKKLEMEKTLQCHLQSDLLTTTEEIRSALGNYYTALKQVKECKKEEDDRRDTEEMLKELRKLAEKYHI
eukprot:Em0013g789a